MTTVLSRGARVRRGGRRPGWMLLTALLVLAIAASSALVFTSRVELLKFAVILALWAAVVAAFVSVIYRRQSDVDQARARDLKLVYDLQLDREISARREYELTVESQLRRELASELRAQAADEVAALRAELAALRTNLEILFDADLGHRPALETERTAVRAYSDWASYDGDSVSSARVSHASHASGAVYPDDTASRTAENPIIDVPEVGVPAGGEPSASLRQPTTEAPGGYGEASRGSHRRASDDGARSPAGGGRWSPQQRPQPYATPDSRQDSRPQPDRPVPQPEPRSQPWVPAPEPHAEARPAAWNSRPAASTTEWQPTPAEGEWLPGGAPSRHWVSDSAANSHGTAGADRSVDLSAVFNEPAPGSRHGRRSSPPEPAPGASIGIESTWHYSQARQPAAARHSAESPSYSTEMTSPTPPPPPPDVPPSSGARHRSADPGTDGTGPQTGGQSVADLLARLQTGSTGGRRGRRRDE